MKHRVLACTLALAAVAVSAPKADIIEQILVKVNGDIITKTELEQRQIAAIRAQAPNARPQNEAELQKALAEVTPEVIVTAVDELLLVQRGKELGYILGDEQFTSILENIKKENKIESDEQFQAALKQEGLTLQDLRRQLERQMLVSRVQQQEVIGKVGVTDVEAKAYYDKNQARFTTAPQYTLREILIAVPGSEQGVNVAADDEAKAKAEDVLTRLKAGEPFPRLAADLSDAPSKANGGLIGPISRDVMSPELQAQLDALAPGALTEPRRTPRGYQILKIETVEPAVVKPFDEARDEISEQIAQEKRQALFVRYLRQLRTQAIIEWKNDEIKRAYEIGLEQQAQEVGTEER